jgi:preprotein translocase subunit SecA
VREPPEAVKYLERNILLNAIDRLWQEHLYSMDSLREAVYLRAYGQKDPLIEYKTEAFDMFTGLMVAIKNEILHNLFRSTANLEAFGTFLQNLPQFLTHADETGAQQTEQGGGTAVADLESPGEPEPTIQEAISYRTPPADPVKVGRNDPCPCGSGKKFKNCCGRNA